MRLDAASDTSGKKVDHITLSLIGNGVGAMQLWWVARVFTDGTTQPEGMFVNRNEAEELASELASSLRVHVKTAEHA
ncbi:MAG: hypothetical protein CVT60_00180 [Actinobacteria bacterium HGW-Actinobacteria-10]|jgi:hypothetical protein|nr:MAG: hypothetical protein CVT60_00180 [Actinobacteria bacterium HGW-Actinobacteria-10]